MFLPHNHPIKYALLHYFGGRNTPLNRAHGRHLLIIAKRRASNVFKSNVFKKQVTSPSKPIRNNAVQRPGCTQARPPSVDYDFIVYKGTCCPGRRTVTRQDESPPPFAWYLSPVHPPIVPLSATSQITRCCFCLFKGLAAVAAGTRPASDPHRYAAMGAGF